MKIAILLFVASCFIGSMALDCSAKLADFHKCMEASRQKSEDDKKAKWEALQPKLDACYASNGCTPPEREGEGKGGKGGKGGGSGEPRGNKTECRQQFREAMQKNFEACVKKAIPGFVFPPKSDKPRDGRDGPRRWIDGKGFGKCKNRQAVRDCQRAIFNSTKPTEEEKKALFQARCDARAKCLAAMSKDCQAQAVEFKKAGCECRQQERDEEEKVKAGIKACDNENSRKVTRPPRRDKAPKSCDQKDYCKEGYDAWVKDNPRGGQGKGRGGH